MENEEEKKLVVLSIDTINSILNYLASRPYSEVNELMGLVQDDAKVIDPSPTPQAEEDAS